MRPKVLVLVAAIAGVCVLISGCAEFEATRTRGKLTFTAAGNIMDCHDATITALVELGVTITGDTTDLLAGRIMGKTAVGDPVTVDLEPESRNTTKIDIRVGYVGDKVQATKIAESIKKHL